MGRCNLCGKNSLEISDTIGFCANCIRKHPEETLPIIEQAHRKSRRLFNLPEDSPQTENGIPCNLCIRRCRIPDGRRGYCGLWSNLNGSLVGATRHSAPVSWYLDPLPTNCVAGFTCTGNRIRGAYNLAVFYEACNLNCLYCQNWHYRRTNLKRVSHTKEVLKFITHKTACICYFGGDPGPFAPHAIHISKEAIKLKDNIMICWETNGAENFNVLKEMAQLSLQTGGIVKIDIKAFSPAIYRALCHIPGDEIYENLKRLASYLLEKRESPPPLLVSTLLVPGYVDEEELYGIANFIASINPEIPWALLAFHPHFILTDLPTTSKTHAQKALKIAKEAGLKQVNIGNVHLLR